jgi:hypothetical protein
VQLDFALEVGAVSEQVTVTGRAELLQTQSADIGNVVDQRQIQDLPLLGRRYSELAFLTPGVVAAPAGITSRGEDTFFNANGNYATWNNYTLDGADNNSFSTNLQERSPQVVQPPVDALQEFNVQTRTYSAEFGKAAGAVINASIKQGTNSFHGSASSSSATRPSTPTPGTTTAPSGPRASSTSTSPASRWAARWCATAPSSSVTSRRRAPNGRCRRPPRCQRRGCAPGT